MAETFTPDERAALAPYFTNLDGPVFALVNLPETVKGALFARYSRSPKSLRRLFLDEFLPKLQTSNPSVKSATSVATPESAQSVATPESVASAAVARAEQLYDRVFNEYGDDSVAQLGGVHLACEDASNVLTKLVEWGRLMAYLEQSTRYIAYTQQREGRWRYHVPSELDERPRLQAQYVAALDEAFAVYARWIEPMQAHFRARVPKAPEDSDVVYRSAIRAKALDTLRGLLPAATQSNVGIYGTGQAYEGLLLRLRASPIAEARAYAELMLAELRKVIPAFLTRVDQPHRGGLWSRYLGGARDATARLAAEITAGVEAETRDEVTLTDFDPNGELKVVAAALYASTDLPDDQLLAMARTMSREDRLRVLATYAGDRTNRRHKPGRAFERTSYRFDVLTDYGAFRDLQRHRLLSLEWQPLSTRHRYLEPEAIIEAGGHEDWTRVMDGSRELDETLRSAGLEIVAPYAVSMAYRVRFYVELNAREAMHVIELRTAPQGHPAYRRVCQRMHRLIAERAGHTAIAEIMKFADHTEVELERLGSERALERKRVANPQSAFHNRH